MITLERPALRATVPTEAILVATPVQRMHARVLERG